MFLLALEGVTRFGLQEAVKAIMQGKLGHAFLPAPPELRMQCDKAMEYHVAMRDRIRHRERIAAETPPDIPPLSDEVRARQVERMKRFHETIGAHSTETEAAQELADIRARYGMTDEVLASIKDQPLVKTKMGHKAA